MPFVEDKEREKEREKEKERKRKKEREREREPQEKDHWEPKSELDEISNKVFERHILPFDQNHLIC